MTFHAVDVPSVEIYAEELYARENEVIKCDYKQRGSFNAISTHFFVLFLSFFCDALSTPINHHFIMRF